MDCCKNEKVPKSFVNKIQFTNSFKILDDGYPPRALADNSAELKQTHKIYHRFFVGKYRNKVLSFSLFKFTEHHRLAFLPRERGKDLRFTDKKGREPANLRLVQEYDIDRLRQLGAISRILFA